MNENENENPPFVKHLKHLKRVKHPDFVLIWTNFLVQKRNETVGRVTIQLCNNMGALIVGML
ncbi:MAG: hypothetical protein ACI30R_04990, partial [Sodaliphilus sp.]